MQPIRKKAVCRGSDFISRTAESDSRRKTWKDFRKIHPVLDLTKSQGIGIRNVISRLHILYDGKAEIRFYNAQKGGACIDIWIPIQEELGEDLTAEL